MSTAPTSSAGAYAGSQDTDTGFLRRPHWVTRRVRRVVARGGAGRWICHRPRQQGAELHQPSRAPRPFAWLDLTVDDTLWNRLSAEAQAEVDGLIAAGRSIQAIKTMRERTGLPQPELRECIDLLAWRHGALQE